MSEPQIRIMIVDEHSAILDSWKYLLESNPSFRVVAQCPDSHIALQEAERLKPDIVLMEVNMESFNAFSATRKILEKNAEIKIVGISVNNQPTYALKMLEAGGRGYLTKTSSFEEIHHGIEEIHNGRVYISEEVRKHMPPGKRQNPGS
jgi:DNA-binding NarL/FixJ family response regulator